MRFTAPLLLAAGTAAAVLIAPNATAATATLPTAGSESASATLKDIAAAGYSTSINWVHGEPDVGLSQCSVTDINAAGASGSNPVVYVTIDCPK